MNTFFLIKCQYIISRNTSIIRIDFEHILIEHHNMNRAELSFISYPMIICIEILFVISVNRVFNDQIFELISASNLIFSAKLISKYSNT